MSCVSTSWKKAVSDDKTSRERKLRYLELQAMNKVVNFAAYGTMT